MASSLGRLADNLPADKFNYSSQAFKGEKLALKKKKRKNNTINGQFPEV